jgi:hypothetical protein
MKVSRKLSPPLPPARRMAGPAAPERRVDAASAAGLFTPPINAR